MKFETKYNIGDKVFWLSLEHIKSYIKKHPYDEPLEILESYLCEGYVKQIDVELDISNNKPFISYVVTSNHCYKNKCYCSADIICEQNIFSNIDEIKNMIKETHKNILNNLKHKTEEILKKYE